MSVQGGTYGSSIVVEEITGTRKWSVTLVGAGLPHQGASWGVESRIPTEFYPGNFAQGTQQSIGPKELPSQWTGKWTRTLLLRSPAIITPDGQAVATATPWTLADFLERLIIGGARLRVTWTQTKVEFVQGNGPGGTYVQNGPITYQKVREGRAQKFVTTPLTADDIKWDVDWKWVSRGATMQKSVTARDGESSSSATAVQSAITDALNLTGGAAPASASNALIPYSAEPDTLGIYETLSSGFLGLSFGFNASLLTLSASLSLSASVSLSTSTSPSQLNNSVLNLSVETVDTANDFTDAVGQIPFEVLTESTQASDVAFAASVAGGQVIQAWVVREQAQKAAQKARLLASTNPGGGGAGVQQTSSTGPGQLLGVARTRQGDTPQSLARQWYGNADRALDLLQANHLPLGTPSFVPGTVLMVPILRSSTSAG